MRIEKILEISLPLTIAMLILMLMTMIFSMLLLSNISPRLTRDIHRDTCWLDGLRGFAVALVALNHAPMVIINLQLNPEKFYFPASQHILFNFLGSIGVQIFFCITGALFANKLLSATEVDWTSFFKKRLLRIVPAYIFAGLLAILISTLYIQFNLINIIELFKNLPNIFGFGLIPLPIINNFNFSRVLGVNWSLAYEWRYYLILPIFFVIIQYFSIWILTSLVLFIAIIDVASTNNSVWVYFLSGAICAKFMTWKPNKYAKYLGYILTSIILFIYFLTWNNFLDFGLERWILMTILFFSLTISRPTILTLRPIVVMGTVSYSFYLLHAMVIFAIFNIYHNLIGDVALLSFSKFVTLISMALSTAVLLSTLSYLFVETRFIKIRTTSN
jgi:peptidoglycan/LPS O-acetylase OafA/YrhL